MNVMMYRRRLTKSAAKVVGVTVSILVTAPVYVKRHQYGGSRDAGSAVTHVGQG